MLQAFFPVSDSLESNKMLGGVRPYKLRITPTYEILRFTSFAKYIVPIMLIDPAWSRYGYTYPLLQTYYIVYYNVYIYVM